MPELVQLDGSPMPGSRGGWDELLRRVDAYYSDERRQSRQRSVAQAIVASREQRRYETVSRRHGVGRGVPPAADARWQQLNAEYEERQRKQGLTP